MNRHTALPTNIELNHMTWTTKPVTIIAQVHLWQ